MASMPSALLPLFARWECDASSAVLYQKGHRANSSPLLAARSAIRPRNGAAVVTGVPSTTSDCNVLTTRRREAQH
jgi:hypothetical protein